MRIDAGASTQVCRWICCNLIALTGMLGSAGELGAAPPMNRHVVIDTVRSACVVDESRRAGHPQCVAWYARPTKTPAYVGYYVGGGAAIGGESRTSEEGTWGWDYTGWRFKRWVAQDWWHQRRPRANREGSYKTDGPKVIPHE